MHSTLVTISIVFMALLECVGFGPSSLTFDRMAIGVAIAVGLIGLPHGGLDHLIGRELLGNHKVNGLVTFLILYLMISAIVVAGWYVSPLMTILLFFSLSAWHFGLEEDERINRTMLQWAGLVCQGGMVIWVPAMFQGIEVATLLNMVLPEGDPALAEQVVGIIQIASPLLIVLAITSLGSLDLWRKAQQPVAASDRRAAFRNDARVIVFFALFAIAHPLLSFGVYFCAWHSIRGLRRLHQQFGGSAAGFGLRLLPISISALVIFAGGFYFWSTTSDVTPALVRTIFIGLSAVAVPHLILHVISDLRNAKSDHMNAPLLRSTSSGVAP